MNTIRTLTTAAVAGVIAVLLAGCGPAAVPVHAEVEWDGENTGEFEDDPRVQVVREYVVQKHAADNAFNYSDPALTEIATNATIFGMATSTASSIRQSPLDSATMWEGPPSFTVTDVVKRKRQELFSDVHVCQRTAPRWTLAVSDTFEKGEIREVDGAYRIEQEHFVEHQYKVWKSPDGWRVDGGGESTQECEPTDEFAVGTYTTPPDIDLLHEATPDMVRGPDGKRVDD
ncbi:hypothetical protein APR04_005391 [Promicromonospora umidemergens]|uniref:Lipoprotein n=1 Tax=Promicromonospora umidemergens TaxID=629679 RepID=A0ABP8YAD5_9MICO|nr:hypothetical protein [Promicromonospora umidemergens]MCP2286454.1 hypothetical protein [Promicromonospora umidemergens]